MNLGKTILQLRRANNITQEDLAAELGVTAAAVSKWENGNTLPDVLMLCALADYFHVTTDELLGRITKWQMAVVAAETIELGQQIAAMAKEYGIAVTDIFTDYTKATEASQQDSTIRYIIAGFHSGFYQATATTSALICVHPTNGEILNAFRTVFEQYLDKNERQIIVN